MKKKLILITAAVLAFAATGFAQYRSLGIRATYGFEISYQHTVGPWDNFVEVDLGYSGPCWFNAVATYDFMIAKPDWSSRGEWGFYVGPGLAIGAGKATHTITESHVVIQGEADLLDGESGAYSYTTTIEERNAFNIGVAVNIGLEYTFWFPLQLSIDFRPQIGYVDHGFGWWGWYPALGIRYRF